MRKAAAFSVVLAIIAFVGCAAPVPSPNPITPFETAASIENEAASLFGDGKFIEAEQKYRLALKQAPNDVKIRLGLASTLARQVQGNSAKGNGSQANEARGIFAALLAERPDALGVVLGAAAGYEALGDRQQAMKLFERGFLSTEDPNIAAVAIRNFATVAYNDGAYQEAVRASLKAYEIKPSAEEASRHLAILNPLGLTKEALEFSAIVIGLYGTDGELLVRAAAAFAAGGDCAQAEKVATRTLEQGKILEKLRRAARLVIDWCHGDNRLDELRAEELKSWPIKMRPIVPDLAGPDLEDVSR